MDQEKGRTGVGEVLVVLLRADLGLLEVLVLDLDELDHCGGCVCVEKKKEVLDDVVYLRQASREDEAKAQGVVVGVVDSVLRFLMG